MAGVFLTALFAGSTTSVTPEMVARFVDELEATRISYYRPCPTCQIKVDTFCRSTDEDAQHYCNICGEPIDVWGE
jgi:hypothetical protein